MRGLRPLASFLIAFALATLAGVLMRSSPAMAQPPQSWSDLSITRPSPTRPPEPRPSTRSRAATDDVATEATVTSETSRPEATPLSSPSSRQPPPPTLRALSGADGDTDTLVAPEQRQDGRIDVSEPPAVADGTESKDDDPRLPADRAAFLTPPAGYDNLAFQIELDPATDNRPARLARFEPFDPIGHRAGSWVIFPSVESGISATTNAFRASNAKPDFIFDVRPTILAVTDWQRHALQFKATGLGSAYGEYPTENDRAYAFEARGRLDITRDANIEVLAAHQFDQETRSSLFTATDAKNRTSFFTDKIAVAYNQRFNRLSIQLRGAFTDTDYQPVATIAGGTLSNDERDLSERETAIRAAWSFSPTLVAFAEAATNTQTYRTLPSDGISRDSTGDRFKAGLSFGNVSAIWRGEVALGYGRQQTRDDRLRPIDGMLIDANLGWRPTALTSLLLTAKTDFLTSTQPGQTSAVQYLAGIELRHAFQRRLLGIASLNTQITDYQGATAMERTSTAELGLEYYLSHSTTLLGKYSHVVQTGAAADNFISDTIRLGVRYRP